MVRSSNRKRPLPEPLRCPDPASAEHPYGACAGRNQLQLACMRCGAVQEFNSLLCEELTVEMARARGFQVLISRFEAGGICRACAAAATRRRRESE